MAFEEDLNDLFDTNEFAVTATFGAQSFPVILDEHYEDELGIEGIHLSATCQKTDADLIDVEDTGTIDGRSVMIVRIEPDGTGLAHLTLEEQ